MGSSSTAILGMVVMVMMMSAASARENELPCVTCSEALQTMEPCLGYLGGVGPDTPYPRCCLAGLLMTDITKTQESRKQVCDCFREIKLDPPLVLLRVQLLRQACVKNIPISSDPTQDCATI